MKQLLYILLICFLGHWSLAQDIHFSHIHASPLSLNPAMTGMFDGNLRLISKFRGQWRTITADYRTFAASVDMKLSSISRNTIIGLGAEFYSDIAGDLDFTTQSNLFSISFMKSFDEDGTHMLSGGYQMGFTNRRFDPSLMETHEQETFAGLMDGTRTSYFDMAAGVLWYKQINRWQFYYLGASLYHLNNPNVTFWDEANSETNQLMRRYVFHGGANFFLNDWFTVMPNFVFMQQGPHQQLTFGSFFRYRNSTKENKTHIALSLGGWLRAFTLEKGVSADAFIFAIRADYANTTFTFTYDVNISTLVDVSYGRGGPEFSLIYLIGSSVGNQKYNPKKRKKKKKCKMNCPAF